MYLVFFLGHFIVVCALLIILHRNRVLSPQELLKKAHLIDCAEMSVLADISTIVKVDREYDKRIWLAIGETPGLWRIARNAGYIVSVARFFARSHPKTIQDEYLEICQRAAELRIVAFWAIPEICLNACHIPYPRLHARQVAYLYSQIATGIHTQFEVFCPDLLPNLGQVL